MKKKPILLGLIVSVILASCSQKPENKVTSLPTEVALDGGALLETRCNACHGGVSGPEGRIAPLMEAVKRHYLEDYKTEESFVSAITAFASNPDSNKVLMHGALNKFGLMPKQEFKPEELDAIAKYIFNDSLPTPEWFNEHWKNRMGNTAPDTTPAGIGRELAMKTKAQIGKNLNQALNKGGTVYAVNFCNTRAIHITDSISQVLKAKIHRVSDKPRNPENAANIQEIKYITTFKKQMAAGLPLKSVVNKKGNKIEAYYAIETNGMCLQCHGTTGKEITPETMKVIKAKYPSDMAVGYKEKEIRGMFKVVYEQKL